jgi:hypothetical protein
MSSFSVCWNRVRLEWRKHTECAPWAQEAILCERVLLEGKPTLRIVCRIARVFEDRIDETSERDRSAICCIAAPRGARPSKVQLSLLSMAANSAAPSASDACTSLGRAPAPTTSPSWE